MFNENPGPAEEAFYISQEDNGNRTTLKPIGYVCMYVCMLQIAKKFFGIEIQVFFYND